jgi:hypothetical protein
MSGDMSNRQFGCALIVMLVLGVIVRLYTNDRNEWNRQCREAHGVPVSGLHCIRADTIGIPWPPKQ